MDPRAQCTADGNSPQYRCQVSFYEFFSGKVDGIYVDVVAYSPGDGVNLAFSDKDRASYEDYSSSLIVSGVLPEEGGYVRLTGVFNYDRSDFGVGLPWTRQVGTISLSQPAVLVRAFEERRRECESGDCHAFYLDGDVDNSVGGN